MPDMDELKGKAREAGGAVQEKAGQATGDREMEVEGNEKKNEGKLEGAWGKAKNAAGDAADAVKDKLGH
ncbi:MAG TPA: CsbD family protein [Dehalococcoidia bacterium]|nr:CsbD family protein [Dehalococcoidia bacterium]